MCVLRRSIDSWRTRICLKISLFGFPETLVIRSATTAALEVVSSSTLIGPFEFGRAHKFNSRQQDETTLGAAVVVAWSQASQESRSQANFNADFSFFDSFSTAEAQVFGVKFIGLYGAVGFIAIRDFSFWGYVHTKPDKFENETFAAKTDKMFSVHIKTDFAQSSSKRCKN